MKKIYLLIGLLTALCVSGCSSPVNSDNKPQEPEVVNSEEVKESGEQEAGEKELETHLELTDFQDYAPFYSMSFQKIEGGTGALLPFEGNTEIKDQEAAVPDQVSVEPYEDIRELGYGFSGEENLADTVTLWFWNRGEEEVVQITLDGLKYEVELPKPEVRTNVLEQEIAFDGFSAKAEEVRIYPNAILLSLSELDEEESQSQFLIVDLEDEENRVGPVGAVYEKETGKLELLYTFESGIPDSQLTLRIKKMNASKEQEPFSFALTLQ